MNQRLSRRGRLFASAGSLFLAVLGAIAALAIAELGLRLNPNWVPEGVRVNPPVRRMEAYQDERYDVKLSNGDLFFWMPGSITPLPRDKDKVLTRVHLVTDADGFRNPMPARDSYDIVASGDSFTYAGNVATPWPAKLAEYIGASVLNIGEPGSGPQAQLENLQRFGLPRRPKWVIMAYFEGNDLYDAAAYELANPFLLTRVGKHLLFPESDENVFQDSDSSGDLYPISIKVADAELEMAFFSYYISWLSASGQMIESSHNFRLLQESILMCKNLSEGVGARFLLVYVPSKPRLYIPYLDDDAAMATVFRRVPTLSLDSSAYLQFSNEKATPELVQQHMDDQALLLSDMALSLNVHYLDLTPFFQQQAATGEELYYPYDTHWNQRGHDLAARVIGEYIEGAPWTASNDQ